MMGEVAGTPDLTVRLILTLTLAVVVVVLCAAGEHRLTGDTTFGIC